MEINRATEQVTRATGQANQISSELYTAAERQSHQIVETNQAISQIVRSIRDVTSSATESSKVAHPRWPPPAGAEAGEQPDQGHARNPRAGQKPPSASSDFRRILAGNW